MVEIGLQVQNSVDAVLKSLDKLPASERNSAIDQIRNLLAQKYGTSSDHETMEQSAAATGHVDEEAEKKALGKNCTPEQNVSAPTHASVNSDPRLTDLIDIQEKAPRRKYTRKKKVLITTDTFVDGDFKTTEHAEKQSPRRQYTRKKKISTDGRVEEDLQITHLKEDEEFEPKKKCTSGKKVFCATDFAQESVDLKINNEEEESEKRAIRKKIVQKKKVCTMDDVRSDLKIPFVKKATDEYDISVEEPNIESPEHFVNVVVVDLNNADNTSTKELSAVSGISATRKDDQELKGYFIKYPTQDKRSILKCTDRYLESKSRVSDQELKEYFIKYPSTNKSSILKRIDRCLENNSRITKEVNVDIHFQGAPKNTKVKRQYNTKTRKCPLCSFVSNKKRDLVVHTKQHEKQFICTTCGKGFHFSTGLKAHEKRHSGSRDFECDYCSFKTFTKSDIARHMVQHEIGRGFVCQYCGKLFSLESTLRVHVRTMHERDEKYPCDQCTFSTYHKPNLRTHIQVHHTDGDSVYKMTCPICHIRIQQKSTYIDHMRSHTGERPFSCDVCSRDFACLSRLNAHKKTVHLPRLFPCPECNKTFQSTHHLQRHLLIHTKERPYSCPKCKHSCNTQGNLTKHMKNTHHISDFSFRKSKRHKALLDSATIDESIKKGQIVSEEYLAHLSARSGKTVTLEGLKKLEEEKLNKPKQKVISSKEQKKKNEKRTKFEHSYHIVELLSNSTEDSLIEGSLDMPVLDMNPISESEFADVSEPTIAGVTVLSPTESDETVYLSVVSKDNAVKIKTTNSIRLNDETERNIYQDIEDDTDNAVQSILEGDISEAMYIKSDSGNVDDHYTLFEVNDANEGLCQSDYAIALDTSGTPLNSAEDYILMINNGNILIIGDP